MAKPFIILSGRSHKAFAQKIAKQLGVDMGKLELVEFSDSETHVRINEDLAGKEVFVVQSGYAPANHHLMELLMIVEAAARMKPKRITAVMPFVPYRRQEKVTNPGESLTFDLVARLLKAAGVKRVLTIDLHKHRSKRFFKAVGISCVELRAFPVFVEYFLHKSKTTLSHFAIVAPDKGSIPESERYSRALRVPLVKCYKHRTKRDQIVVDEFEGDVRGKNLLIIDDEINTAGTLTGVVNMLKKNGAKAVYVACTHGVLSGPALERLAQARIMQVVMTDTIPLRASHRLKKMHVLSVAPLFAQQIQTWTR